MDESRRNFFSNMGRQAVAAAAGVAAPAMLHLNALSDELQALGSQLNGKMDMLSAEVKEQVLTLHNRLDAAALTMSYQQVQLYIIFMLLVLSFAIDGGMTTAWVLF